MNPGSIDPARQPVPVALGLCILNWLIPGAGYLAARDFRRGILLFLLLNGCFAAGLAFEGTVTMPSWNPKSATFNIVAILMFIVQVCHGLGSLAILGLQGKSGFLAELIARNPGAALADLGSFHLLVAGGMNYFATMRLWDLLAGDPGHDEEEAPPATAEGQAQEAGS